MQALIPFTFQEINFIFAPVKQKLTSIVRQKRHKKKANPYFLEDAYAQPILDS